MFVISRSERGLLQKKADFTTKFATESYNGLSKKSFVRCKTKSVLKLKQFADQDQKVTLDDGENQETEGEQAPRGDQGQKDRLVNTDQ